MTKNSNHSHDVVVTGLGESVVRLVPQTVAGRAWIDEHVASEPWQWFGPALCVDPRYVRDLVIGLRHDGLVVRVG